MGQKKSKYTFATFPAYAHCTTIPDQKSHDAKNNALEIISNTAVNAFCIHKLLAAQECDYYVAQAEKLGFSPLSDEYPEQYRNNERLLVQNETIADAFFLRIAMCAMKQFDKAKPFGYDSEGVWLPKEMNSVLKFNKYKQGSKFLPHVDNMYCKSDTERSIFTVIIYLNDDFEGGHTRFYKRTKDLPMDKISDDQVLFTVKPEKGKCLVFNHDVLHDGQEVTKGTKYIIRAEIMFERQGSNIGTLNVLNEKFMQSSAFYMKAEQLEAKGLLFDSTKSYLKGLQMQINYSSSVQEANQLPFELVQYIIRYLNDPQSMARAALTSRRWYYAIMDNDIWKSLYWATYGAPAKPHTENWFLNYKDEYKVVQHKGMPIVCLGSTRLYYGVAGTVLPAVDEMSIYNGEQSHGMFFTEVIFGSKAIQKQDSYSIFDYLLRVSPHYSDLAHHIKLNLKIPKSAKLAICTPHNHFTSVNDNEVVILPSIAAVVVASRMKEGIVLHSGGHYSAIAVVSNGIIACGTCIESGGRYLDTKILNMSRFGSCNFDSMLAKKAPFKVASMHAKLTDDMKQKTYPNENNGTFSEYDMYEGINYHIRDIMDIAKILFSGKGKQYKHLMHQIVLSGGNTLINGYAERVQEEFLAKYASHHPQVFAHPERQKFKWIGVSIMCQDLAKFEKLLESVNKIQEEWA